MDPDENLQPKVTKKGSKVPWVLAAIIGLIAICYVANLGDDNGDGDGTDRPARDATLEIHTPGKPVMLVEASANNYAKVRARLAGHKSLVFPGGKRIIYEVDAGLYAEIEDILGVERWGNLLGPRQHRTQPAWGTA